jgi:ubiquinol-cytochrome c reductase cytochrome c1 subunit
MICQIGFFRVGRSNGNPIESCAVRPDANQDVVTFLAWAAEPEHDDRKLMGVKFIFVMSVCLLTAVYYKRWKWAPLKSRRVIVDVVN